MAGATGHPLATAQVPPTSSELLVDRLLDLPEHLLLAILLLLPTHRAAQTLCLSRRFRHLWSALPLLYFHRPSFSVTTRFVKMVDRAFLARDSSAPLESLSIISSCYSRCLLPVKSVNRWIILAGYLGVRHLCVKLEAATVSAFCYDIFSIRSLESLHVEDLNAARYRPLMPMQIVCTCLKSLNLWTDVHSTDLIRFIKGLPILEHLELRNIVQPIIDISSLSVRTLKLACKSSISMKLCFPKLDAIHLSCEVNDMKMFQGEMLLVSQALFHLRTFSEMRALVLQNMLM